MELQIDRFTPWVRFNNRAIIEGLNNPGIYSMAVSNDNLNGVQFSLIEEIVYFGMTNSKGGLKSRLRQFANTLVGKKEHGGAERFVFKHKNDLEWLNTHLYVSVLSYECNTQSNFADDLVIMGEVAKSEYVAFAAYVSLFGRLPLFNDKKSSPKK